MSQLQLCLAIFGLKTVDGQTLNCKNKILVPDEIANFVWHLRVSARSATLCVLIIYNTIHMSYRYINFAC